MWQKAFGAEHVCMKKTISKLRLAMQTYYDIVTCNNSKLNLSKRDLVNKWNTDHGNCLLDLLKITSNPENFEDEERLFYYAQKKRERIGTVSNEVDMDYEEQRAEEETLKAFENEFPEMNDNEVNDDADYVDTDANPDDTEESANQTVHVRHTRSSTYLTSPVVSNLEYAKPIIRMKRKCTDIIKGTCCKVSYECRISVEKARKTVQIVYKELYSHEYYLSMEENRF